MIWYLYWMAVVATAIVIIKIQAYKAGCGAVDYAGKLFGDFLDNNNCRWVTILVLAVLLSISAILACFGKPLLTSSVKEVKTSLTEKLNNHPAAVGEIHKLLWGTNTTPSVLSSSRVSEEEYPSWWHWKIAFLFWTALLIYTPFAFSDEAMHAIKTAVKAVERRKRLNNVRASSAATAISTPAQTATTQPAGVITKANLFRQILQAEALTEALEIFLKLLMKKLANLFS